MEMNEMMAQMLKCSVSDLEVIKDCKLDMRELMIESCKLKNEMPDFCDLLEEIFETGISMLWTAIDKVKMATTGYEHDLLESLNPEEDIDYSTNYMCAEISIVKNEPIYYQLLREEIEKIEDIIGFEFMYDLEV